MKKSHKEFGFLLLLTTLLYGAFLNNPFYLDDVTKILDNTYLDWPFLTKLVHNYTTSNANDPSRPLVYLIFGLIKNISSSPLLFHLLNLALHLASGALIYKILQNTRLLEPTIVFIAGVFLLHPVAVSTVNYAYALHDVLGTFLALATLYAHMKKKYCARNILFMLGLLSKQSIIILPGLLILEPFWRSSGQRKRDLFLIAIGYVTLRLLYFGRIGDLEGKEAGYSWIEYLTMQPRALIGYFRVAYWPTNLSVDFQADGWEGIWSKVGSIAVCIAALWLVWKRANVAVWSGLIWILLVNLPTSLFVTVDPFVERRVYFALPGFALILVGMVGQRSRLFKFALSVLFTLTLLRLIEHQKVTSIWERVHNNNPRNIRAMITLASLSQRSGDFDSARSYLEKSLEVNPDSYIALTNLGALYLNTDPAHRDIHKALEYSEKALVLNRHPMILFNIALIHQEMGQLDRARAELFEVIIKDPEFKPAQILLKDLDSKEFIH